MQYRDTNGVVFGFGHALHGFRSEFGALITSAAGQVQLIGPNCIHSVIWLRWRAHPEPATPSTAFRHDVTAPSDGMIPWPVEEPFVPFAQSVF